jgi:hypothetical protein
MRYRPVTQSAAGTSSVIRLNSEQPNFKVGLFSKISSGATLTYDIEYTYDQPEGVYATDFETDADWRVVDSMNDLTADGVSNLFYPATAVRINVSSYTDGSVSLTPTQAM